MAIPLDQLRSALSERYELDRELGAGGAATVYLATDRKHHRRVALKVLRPDVAAAVGPARFLREIEIAASLVHPNILTLHDSGEADGLLFYVMPYVEGESLRERLRRDGTVSVDETARIVAEVADALHYAHGHGVVHRDIKPENILFESGHAVVADFGIARAMTAGGDDTVTITGVVVGTPAYMSPEQAVGDRELDARSDVYSLGCVAYEMLTGQRPFAAPTAQGVIARKLAGELPGVRTVAPRISPEVERVIAKVTARAPPDRYASVKEFSTELQQVARGAGGLPSVAAGRYTRIGLAAFVATLIVATTLVWRPSSAAAPPVRALAVLPFTAGADPAAPYLIEGLHDEIISELGKLLSQRVISRTSVMRFRGNTATIPAIARELGVDAIVEGTLYRTSDSAWLQVRLIRAVPEERQMWSRRYSTHVRDLMALHGDVARAIAEQLRGTPAADGRGRVTSATTDTARPRTASAAAYDLYLQGRYWLNRRTADGIATSKSKLRDAIRIDADFAAAHAALAQALALEVDWHYEPVDPIATSRAAIVAANRALALDSTNEDALAARGRVLSAVHAPEALTRRDFERALLYNPQHANARGWFAMELAWRGHGAASRAQNDTAVGVDSLAPGRRMGFAISALNFRDPGLALRQAQLALQLEPTLLPPRAVEALAFLLLNQARNCLKVRLDRYVAVRALCLEAVGQRAAAARLIDSLSTRVSAARRRGGPYSDLVLGESMALYYAWIGNADSTLVWLRHAADISTAAAPFLYINSAVFDRVRSDPKFRDSFEWLKRDTWQKVNTPPVLP